MTKGSTIQDDFSAGELSPRMHGKVSSRNYASGLKKCENWEVTPQGTLERRSGSKHIGIIDGQDVVLQTFHGDVDNDTVVAITENTLTLWNREGQNFQSGGTNIIDDPTFINGLISWETTSTNGAQFTTLNGVGIDAVAERINNQAVAGFLIQNDIAIVNESALHRLKLKITLKDNSDPSNTVRAGALQVAMTTENGVTENLYSQAFGGNGNVPPIYNNDPIPPVGTEIELEFDFIPLASPVTPYPQLNIAISNRFDWFPANSELHVVISDISIVDTTVVPQPAVFPTPSDWVGRLGDIQTTTDSALARMFFTCFGGTMHELTFDRTTGNWSFGPFSPTTDPAGLFDNDQPSTCAIHQGRLWLAGAPDRRSTIWASKSFDYDEFNITDTDPDDALEFTLASAGAVQWLDSLKNLLIGTDQGLVVGRGFQGAISSTDFDFSYELSWNTKRVQPVQIGNETMYISADGSKIRSLFDGGDAVDGYASIELSILAEHILRRKATDIAYAQNPDYQMFVRLNNSELGVCTYFRGARLNAWYTYKTLGQIKVVTTSNDIAGTSLWMAVARDDGDGGQYISLEVNSASEQDSYYVDNFSESLVTSDLKVIGLEHLDGFDCDVIIYRTYAGQIYPILHESRIVENGEIQLDSWVNIGEQVIVGIPYVADADTLDAEGLNPAGTSQTQKRRHNEIYTRVFDSAAPLINGKRPRTRVQPDLFNLSQPLTTGDLSVVNLGWDGGSINIKQDLPLPTQISAIFAKSKGNNT